IGIPPSERIAFSDGWLTQFKQRWGLKHYVFHGEAASVPGADEDEDLNPTVDEICALVLGAESASHAAQPFAGGIGETEDERCEGVVSAPPPTQVVTATRPDRATRHSLQLSGRGRLA
ncbi:hypothetical protein FRC10_006768, partial [Ceratobasidium sp. 414]